MILIWLGIRVMALDMALITDLDMAQKRLRGFYMDLNMVLDMTFSRIVYCNSQQCLGWNMYLL